MLRVRDERRRMRHVETLRKNKEEDDGGKEAGPDAEPHVELLGEQQDEEVFKNIQRCVETFMSAEPPTNSTDSETHEKVGRHGFFYSDVMLLGDAEVVQNYRADNLDIILRNHG